MLYPLTVNVLYIQTDNIISMTVSGGPVYTIVMTDASTHTVTAAQFADIIAIVNAEANN
jgi:hypothetical protein